MIILEAIPFQKIQSKNLTVFNHFVKSASPVQSDVTTNGYPPA